MIFYDGGMRNRMHVITGGTPGLLADAHVISVAAGERSNIIVVSSRQRNMHGIWRRLNLHLAKLFDRNRELGIFLENIPNQWIGLFQSSVFIPNQEWLRPETVKNMEMCSEIWCKTQYAKSLFENKGYRAKYLGFASRDMYDDQVNKDYSKFIHVPGMSGLKGTATVLEVWSRNPHWPAITVVTRDKSHAEFGCHNIKVVNKFLSDIELSQIMNGSGVHICTSETEGFGHYLNEAKSTKAVVVTTDAPPMNEHVQSTFGFLVPFKEKIPQGMGDRFLIDPEEFERQIEVLLTLENDVKIKMGLEARKSFLDNGEKFAKNLVRLISDFGF